MRNVKVLIVIFLIIFLLAGCFRQNQIPDNTAVKDETESLLNEVDQLLDDALNSINELEDIDDIDLDN